MCKTLTNEPDRYDPAGLVIHFAHLPSLPNPATSHTQTLMLAAKIRIETKT
jgi:hypothetical protein